MFGNAKSRDPDAGRPRPGGQRSGADRPAERPAGGDRGGQRPVRNAGNGDAPAAPGGASTRRMSGSAAAEYAKAHLMELTGRPCEAVSSLNRTRDGWRVVLEVIELERIPRTTDILASYSVELDEDGELMGYERINRYYRNDVDGDQ